MKTIILLFIPVLLSGQGISLSDTNRILSIYDNAMLDEDIAINTMLYFMDEYINYCNKDSVVIMLDSIIGETINVAKFITKYYDYLPKHSAYLYESWWEGNKKCRIYSCKIEYYVVLYRKPSINDFMKWLRKKK